MNKDYLLLGIVSIMSVAANLPDRFIGLSGIDRKLLLVGLLLVVSIALVRYSKFALVLAIVILAIGANLPAEIAEALNVDPQILVVTLLALVLFSLANKLFKLPTGLDRAQGFAHQEGSKALFAAIANGRVEIASRLIEAGANVNGRSRQGYTALMIAASHGHYEIVRLLLEAGADPTAVDAQGRNSLQIARESGREACAGLLLDASKAGISGERNAVLST